MKIFKIFILKIGDSNVIRKLPIDESFETLRALYPIRKYLILWGFQKINLKKNSLKSRRINLEKWTLALEFKIPHNI